MIILNTKNFDELKKESNINLEAIGFNSSPGNIARLFMNIINKNIANLYNTLTINHLRAFLTTSYGEALDDIGALLHCKRNENEQDDNYKYRISQQCISLASSNETSIRLTSLTVKGVEDILLKEYSMGTGSFSVIVLPNGEVEINELLKNIENKIKNVHGYGIRFDIILPDINPVSIKQKIFLKNDLSDIKKQEIKYEVQTRLSQYFNSLTIGEDIIIDKITQIIMNTSPEIIEESNVEFKINNKKAIYVNQKCRWFEMFTLSKETDNVIIL